MKFLRELFHQDLDAEGEVEIVGEVFLRRDILKQLAPGPYEVFARWVPFTNRATNAPYTVLDGATSRGTGTGSTAHET